jgi:hypothetical protein
MKSARSLPSVLGASQPGEGPIERRSKGLLCPRTVDRWSAGHSSGGAYLVHEIPDRQALSDGLPRVLLAPGVQHDDFSGHEQGGEWNILRHHQISRFRVLRDVPVGHIRSAVDPDSGHVRVARWRVQALVGNEDSRDLQTFGGTEYDVLDVSGRRIRIDPDLQTSPCYTVCAVRICSE